jgi:ribose transport system permease protein
LGTIFSGGFLSYNHVLSILRNASFLGIVAIGQTIVILTGGIDLSVGPLISMGNLFTCMFINGINSNTLWVLIVVILLGSLFGSFNGFGIAYLKIPPLVMTLAFGSVLTGINLISTKGASKGLASPILRYISTGRLFDFIPLIILIWVLLSVFFILLLNSSTFGRKIYYTGANEKAAFLSGIKTNLIKILAYSISGATSSLTGALMAGYTVTAFLDVGNVYIMWSITAVVIGGTFLTGGKGGYFGTIAGCIILVLLESILTIVQIPEAGRIMANGLLILILISIYFKKK